MPWFPIESGHRPLVWMVSNGRDTINVFATLGQTNSLALEKYLVGRGLPVSVMAPADSVSVRVLWIKGPEPMTTEEKNRLFDGIADFLRSHDSWLSSRL